MDFHSTRPAYAKALARVGVNEETAMVLTGHTDRKVHQRYVSSLVGELSAAALPAFTMAHAGTLHDLGLFLERATGLEPVTPSLGIRLEGGPGSTFSAFYGRDASEATPAETQDPAVSGPRRPNAASNPPSLPLSTRDRLLALANRLLGLLPNPSAARALALEIVRELDPVDVEGAQAGSAGRTR